MKQIMELRGRTAVGLGLCKEALQASGGDMEKAVKYINDRSDVVSRLHATTRAKILLCRLAYKESGKKFDRAVEIIKERGWGAVPGSDEDKNFEGVIEAYMHGTDHKMISLVELTCKTSFVAKSEKFREFAHAVALHVAATKPNYVSSDDIGKDKIKEMKEVFKAEFKDSKKPEDIVNKIIDGKMEKFYSEQCLLDQAWLRDESKTVKNKLDELIGQVGEPVKIRRILIWKFGE